MASFFGRALELDALEKRWASQRSEMIIIYGRRRIGKSELIRAFARDKRVLFSVGTRSDRGSQVHHFLEELALLSGDPSLARLPIRDWDIVFERLDGAITRAKGKTVIVFDEFQWLAESSPEIPSLLQKWWDTRWSRNGKAVIILCGSYLGFMEREVLGKASPLFGRKTGLIRLGPLSFGESRLFHRNTTVKDQMKRYLICGGIPAYHKLLCDPGPLSEGLMSAFFAVDAPLAQEADFLFIEELRDPKLYFSLMENLGQSRRTVTELAQAIGIERSRLPYYTKNLIGLGYLDKVTPFLRYQDSHERKVVYRISDPLLRFWFTFIYPHQNTRERMNVRMFYSTIVSPALDQYFGLGFEDVAATLFVEKRLSSCAEPMKRGAYWDAATQIDFVVALKSGFSYLGEVKWGAISRSSVADFLRKLSRMPKDLSYKPVIVTMDPVAGSLSKETAADVLSVQDLVC